MLEQMLGSKMARYIGTDLRTTGEGMTIRGAGHEARLDRHSVRRGAIRWAHKREVCM